MRPGWLRRARALGCVLAVAGAAGCAAHQLPAMSPGLERYQFDVEVRPSPTAERMFTGTADVTDTQTGRHVAAPEFILRWGNTAHVMTSDPETGAVFTFDLVADAYGRGATYVVSVRRGDELTTARPAEARVGE